MRALSILILLAAVLSASAALADKVIIYYTDGTEQTISLEKPYDRIEVQRDEPLAPAVPQSSYISVDPSAANRGQTIQVQYFAVSELAPTAWIGMVPSDIPHGDGYENDRYDVLFVYLKGRNSGTFNVTIPGNIPPGEYEFRLFDTDDNGREIVSSQSVYIY